MYYHNACPIAHAQSHAGVDWPGLPTRDTYVSQQDQLRIEGMLCWLQGEARKGMLQGASSQITWKTLHSCVDSQVEKVMK